MAGATVISTLVACATVLLLAYLRNSSPCEEVDMFRIDNFSAGPGTLPIEVLKRAHGEFFNYENRGMSVWFTEL